MSGSRLEILRNQISAGDYAQAEKTVDALSLDFTLSLDLYFSVLRHAVHAKQPVLVDTLTEKGLLGIEKIADSLLFVHCMEEVTLLLAACGREKMDEPAKKWVTALLAALERQSEKGSYATVKAVASFANFSGRYALRKKDVSWFAEVCLQTAGWTVRSDCPEAGVLFWPVLEAWMHRINRHALVDALPALFDALLLFLQAEMDKGKFWRGFLPYWRTVATIASLNPLHSMASDWVEQLLLLWVRGESTDAWRSVVQSIGEVSRVAVRNHEFKQAFPMFRPLTDLARVTLADELKFGSGPDPDSSRQKILRLVCEETLRICDMSARNDISSVAGDRIEEMFQYWTADPAYESQFRSIQRFCQLMLIYWSLNRRKASRKWEPREPKLTESVLSEEDREKLSFLL